MKTLFIYILLLFSLQGFAGKLYVSSTGNNGAIGSLPAFPLATISHAANIATNDTIYIMGTNTTTAVAYLNINTSVMNYGANAKIISTITGATVFSYYSATIVNGSTSQISGIEFDGQNIAYGAIMSSRVGGMTIRDNYIHDFRSVGIHLYNPATTAPACVGTTIYNNIVTNCARYLAAGSYGNIWTMGQKNLIVRKNIVTASFITGDSAGFAYKASHLENAKIDSNEFYIINHNDGVKWAFAIEINNSFGGNEIAYNTLQGILDVAGNNPGKGIYEFCLSIHDNLIGHPELTPYWQLGIILESYPYTRDILIYNNHTRNVATALSVYHLNNNLFENVKYHHNLIDNVGRTTGGGSGYAINISGNYAGSVVRNIEIDNNTIVGSGNGTAVTAIAFSGGSKTRNIKVRNNIISTFPNAAILTPGTPVTGSIDTLTLQNNLIYNCGNSNNPRWYGITPINLTNTGTIKENPLFIGSLDFKLQTGSPAIDAGLNIGYGYLYAGPDMGAFEYEIENPVVTPTVLLFDPVNKTSVSIYLSATVANDGGGIISDKGICYGTSPNPTTAGNKICAGTGLRAFDVMVPGLKNSTTYYIRSYAINQAGTAYSPQLIVKTKPSSKMGSKGKSMRYKGKVFKY